MATTSQALACTWIFLPRFEDNLDGFHIMKKNSCASECHWTLVHKVGPKLIFLLFRAMISRHPKMGNLWIHIFQILFKTDLPYLIDKKFLNEYLRLNTALKMQSDFKCIFLPKMYQSLRTTSLWTTDDFQKNFTIFQHSLFFMHNITECEGILKTSLPDPTWICLNFTENGS